MTLDLLILYFFCYSLLGYIVEVVYCSIGERRLVNRGFLHGPYLPIYGFGALLILLFFSRFSDNFLVLFLLSVLGTSALEYLTSYLLEVLFHAKLWDYTSYPLNIHGRVCALNSTLFGLLSLSLIYVIHPTLVQVFSKISEPMLSVSARLVLLINSIDTTSSVFRMAAFQKQLGDFRLKVREIEERIDLVAKLKPTKNLENLRERLDGEREMLRQRLERASQRILDAFPSITSANEEKRLLFEVLKKSAREGRVHRKEQRLKIRRMIGKLGRRRNDHA
ncbi:MAG: putative ABC transporter permease [Sphaerochaeta sp.]|nr:putative ABC transporter permease [Sphaerochaeta sp.]